MLVAHRLRNVGDVDGQDLHAHGVAALGQFTSAGAQPDQAEFLARQFVVQRQAEELDAHVRL